MSLDALFRPRAVAVVGSTAPGKLGYELVRQLVDGGYQSVYAVNPKAQGAWGAPGFSSLDQAPAPIDSAVIVSPPAAVVSVLEDCGRAGVTAAVIITSGFSEVGNKAGEREIQEVAARHGIRFIGPNCAGMVNTHHQFCPTLETRPPSGGVSLIAQSGALGGIMLAWAKEFGLGIAKFVSYGNRADLGEVDFLRYLKDDPETLVVALYIESVASGPGFMEALRACARCKPVIVIKAGRTQSGRRATLSHTGSLAGADAVYDAAIRQSGALRVHSVEEIFDLCKAYVSIPPMTGSRVAIVTNSGGPGVLAADRAEELGLSVTEPSSQAKSALGEFLPPHCAIKNPIDLTVEGNEAGYRRTLEVLLPEYDAVVALNIAPPYLDSTPLARGICEAASGAAKPVLASFLPGQVVANAVEYLQSHGVPNFATGERAVAALANLRLSEVVREAVRSEKPAAPVTAAPLPGAGPMLEPDAMRWLGENGLPVPEYRFVTAESGVAAACRELGYPVVMKVVSPDIIHKSDVGGVVLDIRDDAAALIAYARLQSAAKDRDFRGVVLYPMLRGGMEILVGCSRDPQFGPVIAVGMGGIYTEVLRDVALRVAPVSEQQALAMVSELRAFPLLQGARGQGPRDLAALVQLLTRFSELPLRYPEAAEIDLNPVFLFEKGLAVGDVRVIRSK